MKYIKTYESSQDETNPIQYSEGDIVVCSMKEDRYRSYLPYIDQYGNLREDKKHVRYGKKYKILQIYWSKVAYNHVRKRDLGNFLVDVEDIETGQKMTYIDANKFTLESKFKFPDEPMIGDYVICDVNYVFGGEPDEELNNFINNHIGRYVNTKENGYIIEWRNVPNLNYFGFYNDTNPLIKNLSKAYIKREQIKEYSKNREDLEHFEQANKYNL